MPPIPRHRTDHPADVVFRTDGPVARLCRDKDWGPTPLGSLERWPQCLRTAAGMVVAAPCPMLLLWGPELAQLYSDAYAELLGRRHPAGLGQPTRECWTELWAFGAPLYDRVLRRAEAFHLEDQALSIRRDDRPARAFFELSIGPVPTAQGEIGGVLVLLVDTTARVQARRAEEEHREAAAALRDSEARYRTLAALSPVASLIIHEGRYAFANAEAGRLLGFERPEEILGRSFVDFVPAEDHPRLMERIRTAFEDERPVETEEGRVQRRDGSLVDVEVSSALVPWDGAQAVQVVLRDVTSRKRTEEALKLAKQAAETASRAKSDLLATMSHELRTPLNAVIGLSDLMAEGATGPVSPVQRENLTRIKTSAWHLVGLIDEILGFTRSETINEHVHLSLFDLAEAIEEIVQMLAHDADARDLLLDSAGTDRPVVVRTDETKVRQILTNLVGNALKYTDYGGVQVELRAHRHTVEVRVHDTGPGIPPDRLQDIFEPFVQVDTPATRARPGTGLGLAISRRLALLLGGEITVDSVVGEGSTFTLTLPRE